jgi:hypothetical protein
MGMTPPSSGDISVRSINQEIIGMDGPNHLVNQIIPSIGVINPSSFRLHAMNNRLTFSSVGSTTGRLGIFAAQNGTQQRAVILLLPSSGTPSRLLICITQGFGQAARDLEPLGWSNPLSRPFVNFCLLSTSSTAGARKLWLRPTTWRSCTSCEREETNWDRSPTTGRSYWKC